MSDTTSDGSEDEQERKAAGNVADRILAAVPDWFVPLGAGSLATAALISLVAAGFVVYSVATGTYFGYTHTQLSLAAVQLVFATIIQGAGSYFALQRRRWLFVVLACLFGSILIVTIPFTALAFFTLTLSQPSFRTTRFGLLERSTGDGGE
ncbi:MAG: hypothetical protein ABEJ76_03700 [Halanaeroarchaeum sp.]